MDARRHTTVSSSDSSARLKQVRTASARSATSWILRERSKHSVASLAGSKGITGQLPTPLLDKLVGDPVFQVMSLDRNHWICPYTGRAVSVIAAGGRLPAARDYLEHSGVWRNLEPMPLPRVQLERWLYDLSTHIEREPRLRMFSNRGDGWLNPFTGDLVPGLALSDGVVAPETITRMAEALAASPAAANAPLLSQEEILRRFQRSAAGAAALASFSTGVTDSAEVVWLGDADGRPLPEAALAPTPPTLMPPISSPVARPAAAGTTTTTFYPPPTTTTFYPPPTTTTFIMPGTMSHPGQTPGHAGHAGGEDLTQARRVQQRLHADLPLVSGIGLGVHFAPRSGVGGDFYHVAQLTDGRLLLAVGDVSGHGVQAALVAATALKTLRFVLRGASDPLEIVLACNDELSDDLLPSQFISLFVAIIDPRLREVAAVCAGHHPALLVNLRREFPVQRVGRPGMAIGLGRREALARKLKLATVALQAGDVLVQATDGLIEASDAQGQHWGEAGWMASMIARCDRDDPQELADGLVTDLKTSVQQPIDDDLTVLVASIADDEAVAGSI